MKVNPMLQVFVHYPYARIDWQILAPYAPYFIGCFHLRCYYPFAENHNSVFLMLFSWFENNKNYLSR